MTFLELALALEQQLGSHQLPIRANARGLADLLDGSALHAEAMRRVLAVLFGANRCRQLSDPVDHLVSLEALGVVRHDIHQAPASDVDLCRAIDALCDASMAIFNEERSATWPERRALADPRGGACIIPLDPDSRRGPKPRDES